MTENYEWLPPDHRPGGPRANHDDYLIWPFTKIPPRGQWQRSKVTYLDHSGKEVTKEYYARTLSFGPHESHGARWTSPDIGTPYDYVTDPRFTLSWEDR